MRSREFDDEQSAGVAPDELLHRGAQSRNLAGQIEQRAIHQFDGGGLELHDGGDCAQSRSEVGESTHSEHRLRRKRHELKLQLGEECEGTLRSNQKAHDVTAVRGDSIEIVTGDPAHDLGDPALELVALASAERREGRGQLGLDPRWRDLEPEAHGCPVGERSTHTPNVVDHHPITNRARTRAVVRGHPTQSGSARGGHVDREEEAVGLELAVESVQDHPGLYENRRGVPVEFPHFGQILAGIHHEPIADGLTGLRGAGTSRCHGQAGLARDLEYPEHVRRGLRNHNPGWLDLIDGRVGGVEPSAE